jgi:oxygen-dependent protoporphyrinogen oxidase
MERDDEGLAELAVRDFRVTTGFDARPISVERVEVPAWDTSWGTLRDFSLPDGLHVAANWKDRPGIPGRLAQARRLAGALADRSLAAPSVSAHG